MSLAIAHHVPRAKPGLMNNQSDDRGDGSADHAAAADAAGSDGGSASAGAGIPPSGANADAGGADAVVGAPSATHAAPPPATDAAGDEMTLCIKSMDAGKVTVAGVRPGMDVEELQAM